MSSVLLTLYPHRHNADGTYDSICRTCYRTVGSSRSEDELGMLEELHVCMKAHLRKPAEMLDFPRRSEMHPELI